MSFYRILVGTPLGKRQLGRSTRIYEDNIMMYLGKRGCGDGRWLK
jgi:hypothetical protein